MFETVMEHLVPSIFTAHQWTVYPVIAPTNDYKFTRSYKENFKSFQMVHAMYRFERLY